MNQKPIIYDGAMFLKHRTDFPPITIYKVIKHSGVSRQQIKKFEAGGDIKLSTLTKLLTALIKLKSEQP